MSIYEHNDLLTKLSNAERELAEARAEVARLREELAEDRGLEFFAEVNERARLQDEVARLREALQRLADCDWVITPHDRMDAVRTIAREALAAKEAAK